MKFNRKSKEKIFNFLLYLASLIVIVLTIGLLTVIFWLGLPQLKWSFLTGSSNYLTSGGIGIQLFNTFYLLILTLLISVPLALGTAIWLYQYAKESWLTNLIRIMLEVLSSLPAIVIGLVGFLLFVVKLNLGFSLLSGSLTLTILNLPLLTRTTENALRAVDPRQLKAGLALGLSRWDCVRKVVIANARPAIVTGIILSSGRIIGETAAVIYTVGQSAPQLDWTNLDPLNTASPLSPFRPAETLAVHIWRINTEGSGINSLQVSTGAAALLVLLIVSFDLLVYSWLWWQRTADMQQSK
ncbi:phosphate ABC transporter permease PstA [Liquorilactobacillus sicerae]|uniref:phosphate ABC transporter permease PstA n=1 Tax=Liquorilactobacillus sicerae TaxID=1416943 RepID=UPI00247FCA3B|nr:phosphate ABC transporter permease PstA [Liquorilactobacillus sicerae]